MDLNQLLANVTAKFGVLELTAKASEKAMTEGNRRECERKLSALEAKLDDINVIKGTIEEAKLLAGEEFSVVEKWSDDFEADVRVYEGKAEEMCSFIRNRVAAEQRPASRNDAPSENEKPKSTAMRVKLPKLEITKFNGGLTEFMQFWNTFNQEIDRSEIPGTSKFSYLKEYLGPKVRPLIESLPFTTEGYVRAKTILESKYGRSSEIINAHVQNIMNLPSLNGANPGKVNDFYEILFRNVQALETLGKLESVNGYVRMVLDRLPGIRSELVRDDDDWHEWRFPELVNALRRWTERNPVTTTGHDGPQRRDDRNRDRMYQTGDRSFPSRDCVYCQSKTHKSVQCTTLTTVDDRKKFLAENRRCFNCTGAQHQARNCKSKRNCAKCNGKHHTSICGTEPRPAEGGNLQRQPLLVSQESTSVVYPTVIVQVRGVKCRAVLDTMAGSSYISAGLLEHIGAKKFRPDTREIEMMFNVVTKKVQIFNFDVHDCEGAPILNADFTKVDRKELLNLPNPRYDELKRRYAHLSPVKMDDTDTKDILPIHIILGNNEFTRIKTANAPLIGVPGEPVAEYTRLGWTIMSPGKGDELLTTVTRSVSVDFENLCRLDVLGIQDTGEGDQGPVYENFREQLVKREDGRYETGLLWKPHVAPLQNNKEGSRARLSSLLRKYKYSNPQLLKDYDAIIQEQIAEGIVEVVSEDAVPGKNEFYIPHKPVVREQAQSTKMRIVYDGSARANAGSPSLNDTLETGPPLQNLIWDVILRNRFHPIAVTGDIQKAFLQVAIRESDRDALRFHWVKDLETLEQITLRFARALFGLNQSPFLLGAVVREHLKSFAEKYPEIVREILLCLYVDDLIHGAFTVERAEEFKRVSTEIFGRGKFILHKWQSNVPALENAEISGEADLEGETTFAKQKLGGDTQTKILGLLWDKENDTLSVVIPEEIPGASKRIILKFIAAIYDVLGLICPVTLKGKHIFREACETKQGWDAPLVGDILKKWKLFIQNLPKLATVPRPLAPFREGIDFVDLHMFSDASKIGTAAVVYAIVHQPSGVTRGLVAAKSRLSKKMTIPRLELTAVLVGANLFSNIRVALQGIGDGVPIRKSIGWSDSTTALHWIKGHGNHQYKQFVSNMCGKISKAEIDELRHVPGDQNPADIASRGADFSELDNKYWYGPDWLEDEERWPENIVTETTDDTKAEEKTVKEVLRVSITQTPDNLSKLMEKFRFKKAVRITGWLLRYKFNCTPRNEKRDGPLTTAEIRAATNVWIRRAQAEGVTDSRFEKHVGQLNLVKNSDDIYVCMGRIQGHYPIYLPTYSTISEKLVAASHQATLHGGVGLTMAHVREHYWIPRLRQLAKKLRKGCFGCKRMHATPLHGPPMASLPVERTVGNRPFEVIGLDYAGPFPYKISKKREGKAYLMLYTCSLTRAVHLELLPDQSAETFIPSLKAMIARRGRPSRIYSDNFSTFISSAKWLKRVARTEETNDFLASNDIEWRFNLSRAPWWGGQFERMVGVVKDSLYKTMGKSVLTWNELSEVLLDVETCVNNRPLSYADEDIEMPLLTPNMMIFGHGVRIPEGDPDVFNDTDLRKRARFLKSCKDRVWNRWRTEYLRALRERHDLTHDGKTNEISVGDVMLIKGDQKNRQKWKIGIVKQLITGRDGVVRGATLRAGRDTMERAVQHLYPMEMTCDLSQPTLSTLNPTVETFEPRRAAAVTSEKRTKEMLENESGEPQVE